MNAEYGKVQQRLCRGWNTFNTWSVLSHVLLPEGIALNLSVKEYRTGAWLREALIGRRGSKDEKIFPGPHAYDGSYTELTLLWRGIELCVQSAHDGGDEVILVTPLKMHKKAAALIVECGILWNRSGSVRRVEGEIEFCTPSRTVRVYAEGAAGEELSLPLTAPHFTLELSESAALSTGKRRSVEEVRCIVRRAREAFVRAQREKFGENHELYAAMQSCLAWDTIYEPQKKRVLTTVSRQWNIYWGGYILFEWDTYFTARMISLESRDLAYANAVEITLESAHLPFVPNNSAAIGVTSGDRSQPPVGSRMVLELYRAFGDKWLLEMLFDRLYGWNEWYFTHRNAGGGLLSLGSEPFEPTNDNEWETNGVNDRFGAALESGMDNSPMYDDIPFDKEKHMLCLADAGLTGLFIMDCRALMEIASVLGRHKEQKVLAERLAVCSRGIQHLWDEENGFFYNLRTDTHEFSRRISPTNFYALFADGIRPEQIRRVIDEHLMNEEEFFGQWMLPSIARNDPEYPKQEYWRGRIWAPLNYLTYLAFSHQNQREVCRLLADKSAALLLKGWREHGWVCENYDADIGSGEVRERIENGKVVSYGNSDRFYAWGGLLALIALNERAGCERSLYSE